MRLSPVLELPTAEVEEEVTTKEEEEVLEVEELVTRVGGVAEGAELEVLEVLEVLDDVAGDSLVKNWLMADCAVDDIVLLCAWMNSSGNQRIKIIETS